jgi:hypothetical protein
MMSNARASRRRSSKKPPAAPVPAPAPPSWRLPSKLVADFLGRERGLHAALRAGEVSPDFVESAIAEEDPASWAALRLFEEQDWIGDSGEVWTRRGENWKLADVQARMARLRGNLIFECAAEVGKSRDLVLQVLWGVDTQSTRFDEVTRTIEPSPLKILIVGNRERTTKMLFRAITKAIKLSYERSGYRIGGGLAGRPNESDFRIEFNNESTVELTISGTDGENIKGGHYDRIFVDEASAMKNPTIFDMVFRALKAGPGAFLRIYSTPDGDYSSPFWGLCNRATPIDDRTFEERQAQTEKISSEERAFSKFNISKDDLPAPFMTPERRKKLVEMYGGEHSVGFVTLFLGRWGSPSYSVFPMVSLKPNLRTDLDSYRLIVVENDKTERRFRLRVSRLGRTEDILVDERAPFLGGDDIGERVARFIDLRPSDLAYCGVDLGFSADPSELLFVTRIGEGGRVWEDRARIHLRGVDSPDTERIFLYLDHAALHAARYSLDSAGNGASVVDHLQKSPELAVCPICRTRIDWTTRLIGTHPQSKIDFDVDTGETVLSDERNAAGERIPAKLEAKEWATRVLERKMQKVELRIGRDAGAGDPSIAAETLLVNHVSLRVSARGVRIYKDQDDHSVDARRHVAYSIGFSGRRPQGFIGAERSDLVATLGGRTIPDITGGSGGQGGASGAAPVAGAPLDGFRIGKNGQVERVTQASSEPTYDERTYDGATGFSGGVRGGMFDW